MKRMYIAVILLIFTTVICSSEFLYINSCADKITERVITIQEAYKNGQIEKSMSYALELEEDWQRKVKKIDMLLYHDYVDDITKEIANLETYIAQEDTSELYSTCNDILTQINSIKKSEFPTLENII